MSTVRRETALLLLGDLVLLVFSWWLALVLRGLQFISYDYFWAHLVPFIPVFAVSLLVFFIAGLYEKQTRLVRRTMGSRIASAQIANSIIAAIIFFILPLSIAPKTTLFLYLIISVICIGLWRFSITPRISIAQPQKALLVGHGDAIQEVFEEVNNNTKYYLHFSESIDTATVPASEITKRVQNAIASGVSYIVLDTRDGGVHGELPGLYNAMVHGITFVDFASFYEEIFDRVPLAHIDYVWLLDALPRKHVLYDSAKRAFDFIGALVGLVFACALVFPAALILQIQGGSPFIFHGRIGKGGKVFRIVKLRTMLFNDHGDPELQKKNRVTLFGSFLRRTRIDELPQLYNILKGDLSFIGPRPELPSIAKTYQEQIPYYEIRHAITPGLSGWAQIRDYDAPRGAADIERTTRKLSYDLYYLKQRSFALDTVIALKTVRALLAFSGV